MIIVSYYNLFTIDDDGKKGLKNLAFALFVVIFLIVIWAIVFGFSSD